MPENSPYFESITAAQSMKVRDPFDTVNQTISLETQLDLARNSISESLRENLGAFLPSMKNLSLEDYEMILAYYFLGQPQWCLAKLCHSTQTLCSFRIRQALKKLGIVATYKGHPGEKDLDDVLEMHDLNHLIPTVKTSLLVVEYRKRRSFLAVADELHLHRPDVRRALTKAANVLMADKHDAHAALGAYIHGFLDKASISGVGFSQRKTQQLADVYKADPKCAGEFIVSTIDPAFDDHFLVSRAAYD